MNSTGLPDRRQAHLDRLSETDDAIDTLRRRWDELGLAEPDWELSAAAVRSLLGVARRFAGRRLELVVDGDHPAMLTIRYQNGHPHVDIEDTTIPTLPHPRSWTSWTEPDDNPSNEHAPPPQVVDPALSLLPEPHRNGPPQPSSTSPRALRDDIMKDLERRRAEARRPIPPHPLADPTPVAAAEPDQAHAD